MSIDLKRFTRATEAIVPLIDNVGKYNGRKIEIKAENGWYKVSLGDQATIVKKASPLEIYKTLKDKKKILVYALGGEGVPVNFENFKQRGYSESVDVYFMMAQPFDVAEVVLWEDGKFYFYGINQQYQRELIKGVKKAYKEGGVLPILRGISPEIRFSFMLGNLQRESYELVEESLQGGFGKISREQRDHIRTTLQSSFGNVLKSSIAKAGGTYIRHYKTNNNRYTVQWEVGGQKIKSDIRADLRIVSAGFCLSNDDKRHSMNSIINLAKDFQERSPLYITRT